MAKQQQPHKAFGTFPTEHGFVVIDVFRIESVQLVDRKEPRVAIVTTEGTGNIHRIYVNDLDQRDEASAADVVMGTIALVAQQAARASFPPETPI
jgi:hypothetical protein